MIVLRGVGSEARDSPASACGFEKVCKWPVNQGGEGPAQGAEEDARRPFLVVAPIVTG